MVLKGKEEEVTKQGMIIWGSKKNSRKELKYFYGILIIQQFSWSSDLLW